MKDNFKKLNWLLVLLSIVSVVSLSLVYIFVLNGENVSQGFSDLIKGVTTEAVSVLLIFLTVYFLLTSKGISPQEEFKQDLVDEITKRKTHQSGFESDEEINQRFKIKEKLKTVKQVDLIGLSCANFLTSLRPELTESVRNGCQIRIITIAPSSLSEKVVMSHQSGAELEPDIVKAKKRVEQIKEDIGQPKIKGSIEIRVVDWIPSMSLIITDKDKNEGEIRVKVYPIVIDIPLRTIKTHTIVYKKAEPDLFLFLTNQFEKLWGKSSTLIKI